MRYFLGFILFGLGLILFRHFASDDRVDTSSPLPKNSVILAVGDSLTYGFGTQNPTQSYPAILERLSGYKVINTGINGETSEEGLKRLPQLLKEYKPALTIICYGGNDILQHLSMQKLEENLNKMVEMVQRSGSKAILIAVPNFTLTGLKPLELYSNVADRYSIPIVEDALSDILSDYSLKSDYVHPNAKGYQVLAKEVYKIMQENGLVELNNIKL